MPDTQNLGVRVLSLDGGGVGVLSELHILESMMHRLKTEGRLDKIPSPCDYFELIGGSGTGGIIALMLGRLRMPIADARSAYERLRPESKSRSGEKFKTSKFEQVLKAIFKQEMMRDVDLRPCKIFVCTMNQMNLNAAIPELFRTYDSPYEQAKECMLWQAARATSATPGLFKPMEIGGQQYIDGGVGNNNPASWVLKEAKQMYPSRPVTLVVSLGSGHPNTIQIPRSSNTAVVANAMKMIASDCERTHEDNERKFWAMPNTYFRFNVQQGLQGMKPHYWGKSNDISAHTRAYLRTEDVISKLGQAVNGILNPIIPVSGSPVYVKVCPAPSARFTGRGDILDKMLEYFSTNLGQRHTFLLHGLGGVGKSQIAFQFVMQSATLVPALFRHIFC
ncbi:FabD lysophospholipase-like protein [Mycena olivaceomarginata]|nr:FabD lysophospholipase-like protein [Mycena olivaceomarginata]